MEISVLDPCWPSSRALAAGHSTSSHAVFCVAVVSCVYYSAVLYTEELFLFRFLYTSFFTVPSISQYPNTWHSAIYKMYARNFAHLP